MTEEHIRALLAIAMAYDNRRPGEANVAAWLDAATRACWTFPEAIEAVKDYYANTTDPRPFVMPSHVTNRMKQTRRPVGQPPKYEGLTPEERELEKLNRGRVIGLIGGSFSMPRAAIEARPAGDDEARAAARAELDAIRHKPLSRQETA